MIQFEYVHNASLRKLSKYAFTPAHLLVASSLDNTLATLSPTTSCCPCKLLRLVTQKYLPLPSGPRCPLPFPHLLQSVAAGNKNTKLLADAIIKTLKAVQHGHGT